MYALSHYHPTPGGNHPVHNSRYSRLETMARASYEFSAVTYSIPSFPLPQTYARPTESRLSPSRFNYFVEQRVNGYATSSAASYSHLTPAHTEYHFQPSEFLKPGKEGRFIGQAEEIKEYVIKAFETIFQAPFPNNIFISLCNEQEFQKIAPHPGTIGLSINRGKEGLISEIFVLNDTLARVMLTLGHELGHVLTPTLPNPRDEEAKAYAFSLVWMNAIKEHDIAGLGDAIVTERPAENGLHNVAFGFVERMVRKGMELWEVYVKLVRGGVSVAGL